MKNLFPHTGFTATLALAASAITITTPTTATAETYTRLAFQVSRDGTAWSNTLSFDPGQTGSSRILVRSLLSWVNDDPQLSTIGLASLTFQPVVEGARISDSIASFANQGNNSNGGGVILDASPLDGPFGRPQPFAATGPAGIHSYVAHRHTGGSGGSPPGRFFRIARNDVVRWMGTGPTSGTAAVNNFNGSGGVASVQKAARFNGPNDPVFNGSIIDINVFQFAIDIASMGIGERVGLTIGAPLTGMSLDPATGLRSAMWFADSTDDFGRNRTAVRVETASVEIIPAPAALTIAGLAGMFSSRRRRLTSSPA